METPESKHAVFQILNRQKDGATSAGTGWFSQDAQELAAEMFGPEFASKNVYAITNNHVVNGAEALFSRHSVARKLDLPLTVVSVCPQVDLALVKLESTAKDYLLQHLGAKAGLKKVPSLRLGDSDSLRPEHIDPSKTLLSIGYPLGSEFKTFTAGAPNGFKRLEDGLCYVQHQASIQPGNSGGVAMMNGLVLGVNSCKISAPTVDNLNLSIPAFRVKQYLPSLVAGEEHPEMAARIQQFAEGMKTPGAARYILRALRRNHIALAPHMTAEKASMLFERALKPTNQDAEAHSHPTLQSLIRGFSHHVGFHAVLKPLMANLHKCDLNAVREMSTRGWGEYLCRDCSAHGGSASKSALCPIPCMSPVPLNVVHVPLPGFAYSPLQTTALEALNASRPGVAVTDAVSFGSAGRVLRRYDVIHGVETALTDGVAEVDQFGEHWQPKMGVSLGVHDLIARAPIGSEVRLSITRDGVAQEVSFKHEPTDALPAIRSLGVGDGHLAVMVPINGVAFRRLFTEDLANPQMQPFLTKYMDPHQQQSQEKVIVASVSPFSNSFHTYSLQPGHVVEHVNKVPITSFKQFCEQLASQPIALIGTESGGVDALTLTEEERQQLTLYTQQMK